MTSANCRRPSIGYVVPFGRISWTRALPSPYLTRLRTDLPVSELDEDLGLQMSEGADLGTYIRVTREGGYTILQYWFFYAMNDWRTIYGGVNDHEADWEKVFVYLSEDEDGEVVPEWTVYSAHNERGEDLRRRWDYSARAG